MNVVEPDNFSKQPPKKNKSSKKIVLLSIAIILTAVIFAIVRSNQTGAPTQENATEFFQDSTENTNEQETLNAVDKKELRVFEDNEFTVFYNNLLQPNLERVENPPFITGNDIADTRIRKIAEDRGSRLRASPSVELVSVDGFLLHEAVQETWELLQTAAQNASLSMSIVSGYRSVDQQRELFMERLQLAGATVESVASGLSDAIVDKVLVESSIPGYSKHHTGYTIDLLCAGYAFENFKNSPCNDWLTANNYQVAKEYGFIPSYPPLAEAQGPDPEAWEYVFVGKELLFQ